LIKAGPSILKVFGSGTVSHYTVHTGWQVFALSFA